jgi:hypothetical protein
LDVGHNISFSNKKFWWGSQRNTTGASQILNKRLGEFYFHAIVILGEWVVVVTTRKKSNQPKRRPRQKPYIDQGKLAKKMAKMAHTTGKPSGGELA